MAPHDSQVPKDGVGRQLIIVLFCSFLLAITCCGGGFSLANSSSKFLAGVGTSLIIIGLASVAAFVLALLFALIRFFVGLAGSSRK